MGDASGRFERQFAEARKVNVNQVQPARSGTTPQQHNNRVPRIIHLMWDSPDSAPDLVNACFDSWRELNPGWEIHVWDDLEASKARSHFTSAELPVQATSDCLRLWKLSETGGIWADATTFPIVPLDEWVDDALGPNGFFAPSAPGQDRLASSWFLATELNSPVIDAWQSAALNYWNSKHAGGFELTSWESPLDSFLQLTESDTVPYYWLHYLYNKVFFEVPEVRQNHHAMHNLPASIAQTLLKWSLQQRLDEIEDSQYLRVMNSVPLLKLNWRRDFPLERLRTIRGMVRSDRKTRFIG